VKSQTEDQKLKGRKACREYNERNREKRREQARAYYQNNKIARIAQSKVYYEKNKEKLRAYGRERGRTVGYDRRLMTLYNLSKEDRQRILVIQNYKCAICGKPEGLGKDRLDLDHNHKTGEPRGLLCGICNAGIGFLLDSVELMKKAIEYLEEPPFYKLVKGETVDLYLDVGVLQSIL